MQHFIVIGNPINHSKSPEIHTQFATQAGLDISYQRQFCPNDKDSFAAVVEAFFAGGGVGANVTLPFKEIAYALCQEQGALSDCASTAKAVNTLALKDGKLYGDNTDGRGLVADLLTKGVSLQGKRVAILGAGGATRGAILPLLTAGADITVFNRTLSKAEQLKADFDDQIHAQSLADLGKHTNTDFDVIINATSATTTGQVLDLQGVRASAAYDMMYGKSSRFLTYFGEQGAACFDGFGMLLNQAVLSFELWTGVPVDGIDLAKVM